MFKKGWRSERKSSISGGGVKGRVQEVLEECKEESKKWWRSVRRSSRSAGGV